MKGIIFSGRSGYCLDTVTRRNVIAASIGTLEIPNQKDTTQEKETTRSAFRKQFPKNMKSKILMLFIQIASNIWLVPFYVHHLGVAAYGLIPIAMSFMEYVALITITISGGVSRFLTIDLQKHNYDQANQIFNTAFWSLLALTFASIPFLYFFTIHIESLIEVPVDQLTSFKWLFVGAITAFFISTISSCFSVSTFAYNRLDLHNYAQIAKSVIFVLSVVLFFLFNPSLEKVALALLISALSSFAFDFFFWRKLTPDLKINFYFFNKKCMKKLADMGGWLVVNHVGYLLFLQIDLIIVNRLFGPNTGGEYASILKWSLLLRSMAGVLSSLLQPMLLICHANEKPEDIVRISKLSVKFMGLGLALPIGLICGFAPEILTLWIGPEFAKLAPLMLLILLHLTVNLSVTPLFLINICYNKIKLPGIVTLITGALNLLLAIFIPITFGIGEYGVALAGAIVLTLKNALFTPWYAARVLGIRTQTFFYEMSMGVLATFALFGTSKIIALFSNAHSWIGIVTSSTLIAIVYASIVWFFMMSLSEKLLCMNIIRRPRNEIQCHH